MTIAATDIATVTPELEAACKKLIEGVQLGGPYLPVSFNRLRVQFPGNHGGVNWGGTSFNPQLGYLFVNTNELGQLSGLRDRDPNSTEPARGDGQGNRVDPNGPYQGFPGGGRFSSRDESPQQLAVSAAALGKPDGGEREHRRVRMACAARRHRQSAAGEAEDRTSRQRRHDRDRRRPGLRRAPPTTAASARSTRRPARSCGPSSYQRLPKRRR